MYDEASSVDHFMRHTVRYNKQTFLKKPWLFWGYSVYCTSTFLYLSIVTELTSGFALERGYWPHCLLAHRSLTYQYRCFALLQVYYCVLWFNLVIPLTKVHWPCTTVKERSLTLKRTNQPSPQSHTMLEILESLRNTIWTTTLCWIKKLQNTTSMYSNEIEVIDPYIVKHIQSFTLWSSKKDVAIPWHSKWKEQGINTQKSTCCKI